MPMRPSESSDKPSKLLRKPRFLFLSAQVGTGHMSAALAIKQALNEIQPEAECLIVDVYKYASKFFGRVATSGYIQLVKFLPQIYNLFYEMGEQDPAVTGLKFRFTEAAARNLEPVVRDFSPDAIICTHAFPSGVASLLKESLSIPMVSVITDFTVHPFWIHANTDLYLVANEPLARHLAGSGISERSVKVTGIPVDSRFQGLGRKRNEMKQKLGLNPEMDTVLVMGGGIGLGPIAWVLRALRKVKHPIQVVVITGTNKRLRRRMERYAARFNGQNGSKRTPHPLKVCGYVSNVYDFMKAADLLVSKPGGLTVSEALVAELPFLIAGPLPGPEIRNAQYLLKEKAAVMARRGKNVARYVDFFFGDPARLERLQERARALMKPEAARDAARHILQLVSA